MMWIERVDGRWWGVFTDGPYGPIEVDRFDTRDEADEAIVYYCSTLCN
jgi:hypothetical protein